MHQGMMKCLGRFLHTRVTNIYRSCFNQDSHYLQMALTARDT